MPARRNYRKKRKASSSDEEDDQGKKKQKMSTVEEIRLLQKLRRKQGGVSTGDLAYGLKEEDLPEPEEIWGLQHNAGKKEEEEEKGGLTGGFTTASTSTVENVDKHMAKYVEQKLAEKNVIKLKEEDTKPKLSAEDELYILPDHLKTTSVIKEHSVAGVGLSGVIEVDLPIEYKMKNIEATEAAKEKQMSSEVMQAQSNRTDGGYSRFSLTKPIVYQGKIGDASGPKEVASDAFLASKFKNRMANQRK